MSSKFSSFTKEKKIFDNWRAFLKGGAPPLLKEDKEHPEPPKKTKKSLEGRLKDIKKKVSKSRKRIKKLHKTVKGKELTPNEERKIKIKSLKKQRDSVTGTTSTDAKKRADLWKKIKDEENLLDKPKTTKQPEPETRMKRRGPETKSK